jgi:lincosamide nucleotidyltransferase A/C/D/E
MSPEDVLEALAALDALARAQTREHTDLDLALDRDSLSDAAIALRRLGYLENAAAVPGLPARLVLTDPRGRQVDLHPLAFDRDGNGWQQLSATGRAWGLYPAADLNEEGIIGGRTVRATSARLQHKFRMGYEWSERDEHFVRLLGERFGLPMPPAM